MFFYVIIVFFLIFGIVGELRDASKNKNKYGNNSKNNSKIRSNSPGRSCLDCKYCDTTRANNEGAIYCEYDNIHYFPETGLNCDDFNK